MPNHERQLTALLNKGWSYVGPFQVQDTGDSWWELRITELPDFFIAGENRVEVLQELRPALRAFLSACLASGDPVPNPGGRWSVFPKYALVRAPAVATTEADVPALSPADVGGTFVVAREARIA